MNYIGSSRTEERRPENTKFDPSNRELLKEIEKDYRKKLQKELREIERCIIQNDYTTKRAESDLLKVLQTSNDRSVHVAYAKQVLQCRNLRARLIHNRSKLQALVYSLESLFTNMRMTRLMGDTSLVLKQINSLMNIKDMQNTIRDIQRSLMQFGIVNELMDEAGQLHDDLEDMSEAEIDKIIDSVQNPDKYKDSTNVRLNPNAIKIDNSLDNFEAQFKELS